MRNSVSALIVARPTRMRDGLRTLLRAMPQIEVVEQVDDAASAAKKITDEPPTLILLDSNLPDHQVQTVLNLIRSEWSQTRCIVLADNRQQQRMATDNGADDVLLVGFPATKLFTTVEKLLSGQEASVL